MAGVKMTAMRTTIRIDDDLYRSVKERAARKARNPATGEEIEVPATRKVVFRPGKELKERVGG